MNVPGPENVWTGLLIPVVFEAPEAGSPKSQSIPVNEYPVEAQPNAVLDKAELKEYVLQLLFELTIELKIGGVGL